MNYIEEDISGSKMNSLPKVYYLSGYRAITDIFLVGCGGTGSYVAPQLARLNYLMGLVGVSRKRIIFIDGDSVEEKNISRQNFIKSDVGKNKAQVLAKRYSFAFQNEIHSYLKYLESEEDFLRIIKSSGRPSYPLIIGCVDNNKTRHVINRFIQSYNKSVFWVDSGNEETNGQVICSFKPIYNDSRGINPREAAPGSKGVFTTPTVVEVFDNMTDTGKFNSELSCAEASISNPQNIMTNVSAANLVVNYINKIYKRDDISSHGVIFTINNTFQTIINTVETLAKVNPERLCSWET